jgi:sigma-B regulation protein RsbU (phosphoserine phosphatase)
MRKNKINRLRYIWSGLTFRTIFGTVFLLFVFGACVSQIGYIRFRTSLTNEYNDSAFQTAETALTLIDGDRIDEWQRYGGESADYLQTADYLDKLCQAQNVTLIYVIDVDTSDYGRFTSVFNAVLAGSGYEPWPIGYERDTTNEEYRRVYQDIYENGLKRGSVERASSLNGKKPHITSLVPVARSDGSVRAILCVQRPMEELVRGGRLYLSYVLAFALGALVLISLLNFFYIRREFVTPVRKIVKEAGRFARDNSAIRSDELDNISNIREISILASSLKKMEADTEQNIKELTGLMAEKERIGAELSVASAIQTQMLPEAIKETMGRGRFELAASMSPAKEIGGDFYDYYMLDQEIIAFVIGDVSGKGIPAALFMVLAKTLLKDNLIMTGSVESTMRHTSNVLLENCRGELFVTCFLAMLDLTTGELRYVNAGHNPPVIIRADGGGAFLKDDPVQLVLAGWQNNPYRDSRIKLQPGDSIFLYTDGVTEARNEAGEFFGEKRELPGFVKEASEERSASECLKAVGDEIREFRGPAEQFDDLTMLMLRYRGNKLAQTGNDPAQT